MNNEIKKLNPKFPQKYLGFILLGVLIWLSLPSACFGQVLTVPSTDDKARIVLSPFAQSVPDDSYTFIAVNHASLDTALTQVGVALEVLGMSTVPNSAAGRAAIFTVDAGKTHRIFIVNVSHPNINSSNLSFAGSDTHLIFTDDSAQFGNIRAVSINSNPISPTTVNSIRKYNNLSQLSFWGVIFAESSSTGFFMEFIGDAHDSTIGRNFKGSPLNGVSGNSSGVTRGIN